MNAAWPHEMAAAWDVLACARVCVVFVYTCAELSGLLLYAQTSRKRRPDLHVEICCDGLAYAWAETGSLQRRERNCGRLLLFDAKRKKSLCAQYSWCIS